MGADMIEALFPKTRRKLLEILFLSPEQDFYLRELVRKVGFGQGAVQRELQSLAEAGLIARRKDGNRVYYRANTQAAIYSDLKNILLKTSGLVDVLKDSLKAAAGDIDLAFVYGSIARGEGKTSSDIDIMIIGEIPFNRLSARLNPAQNLLGREINPTVYTAREFQTKLAEGRHFPRALLNEAKLFIIGDETGLRKLAQGRLADTA